MDASRFDDVVRSLKNAPSRRRVLAGIAAAALGLTMPAAGDAGKGKKRKKKVKRNEFGCVNVGGKCRGKDALCCSGICQGKRPKKGKKDKSRCVGHDEGNCQAGFDFCEAPIGVLTCTTTQGVEGTCRNTTGKSEFCTNDAFSDVSCAKDEECVSECGEGAACVLNCDDEPVCVGLAISCGVG
jgi:hypothetical protein